ncbi:MAG TPA: hypothetical protein VN651_19635 [Gemmatimonadaceae bacterium]|nr:hypothetical protein [Gemmatimonadaceae bacterium]
MADQSDKNADGLGGQSDAESEKLKGDPREENNEWLRDQVGEDNNLSGSSTYRTLPDQPEQDRSDRDTEERQSNR